MESAVDKARSAIREADAILIGASNGLSIAEGYHIFADNDMFKHQFGDFRQRYGIRNVLQGCFYHDAGVRQEFLNRLVKLWIDDYTPSGVMASLLRVIGDKPYFIVTSNADMHLELAGFDADRVFEVEGTFLDSARNEPPRDKSALLNDFLSRYHGCKLVILELGIGSRNTLIKQPLMQLTASEPHATYITLNLPHDIYIPSQISSRSIALPGDIAHTLSELSE